VNAPTLLSKQHLIDPEICIRCNTCQETCPADAVTHDDTNYVVKAEICNHCLDCIAPCPTGAIDNWRVVNRPYTIEEQFSWNELPPQEEFKATGDSDWMEALEEEVGALLAEAHIGSGGKPVAPASASTPAVNIYSRSQPARATVVGNFRITAGDAESDVRHIVLDFADQYFPVLEGQSVGIVPPAVGANERPHAVRLYSVASPRDGEKPKANNLALTIKRAPGGLCSNYICDLGKGATVEVTGPFGASFLMPNDSSANIIMICTGTGSAPFRGFTERRRRAIPNASGKLALFFGARRPEELPYFGPLQKLPPQLLNQYLCYSRIPGQARVYVQDRIRAERDGLTLLLHQPNTFIYICGLRGMEEGVDEAFADVCRHMRMDWNVLKSSMRSEGRYHVETY